MRTTRNPSKMVRPTCPICGNEPAYKKYKGQLVGPLCLINLRRANNNVGFVIPTWYKKAAEK